ncbi:hypothetical protein BST61_g9237 [Cercospora zeina]
MHTSALLAAAAAFLGSASATVGIYAAPDYLTGTQCSPADLQNCLTNAAWGCAQLTDSGPTCIQQTNNCNTNCVLGYAYQKFNSNDPTCVCTLQDARCFAGDTSSHCGKRFGPKTPPKSQWGPGPL